MQKTAIEWVRNLDGSQGYSWNPIRGLCPVDCKTPGGKSYCYARRLYQRFGWDPTLRVDYEEINKPFPKKPSRIFLCSTMELFHQEVDKLKIRGGIFSIISTFPRHTFIILTKMPERIYRPMPKNVWLGVSITGPADTLRWTELQKHPASIRFISAEPLIDPYSIKAPFPSWLILGRLTGYGKKHDPNLKALIYIREECKKYGIPLFMKNNLADIWPGKLIQEFPKGDPDG